MQSGINKINIDQMNEMEVLEYLSIIDALTEVQNEAMEKAKK
jgi:hypothetical protein